MTQVRAIWEWEDNAGGFLRASNWVFATPGLATLEAAIQACSNADLLYATNGIPTVSSGAPGPGTYNLTTDVAVLIFATAAGSNVRVVIPGPDISVFGPDTNVVDPTATTVAALIAAVTGTLGDSAGNVVTGYVSGVKSSRRVEQS